MVFARSASRCGPAAAALLLVHAWRYAPIGLVCKHRVVIIHLLWLHLYSNEIKPAGLVQAYDTGECVSSALKGGREEDALFSDSLGVVTTFLSANPREVAQPVCVLLMVLFQVVVVFLKQNVEMSMLENAVQAAGLIQYAYNATSSVAFQWPTLQEMITDNSRAVLFSVDSYMPIVNSRPSWILPTYTYCWSSTDTVVNNKPISAIAEYVAESETIAANLTCANTSGTVGPNKLGIFTYAVTSPSPQKLAASQFNTQQSIHDAYERCDELIGLNNQPNFISLTHAEINLGSGGTGIDVIRSLNKDPTPEPTPQPTPEPNPQPTTATQPTTQPTGTLMSCVLCSAFWPYAVCLLLCFLPTLDSVFSNPRY